MVSSSQNTWHDLKLEGRVITHPTLNRLGHLLEIPVQITDLRFSGDVKLKLPNGGSIYFQRNDLLHIIQLIKFAASSIIPIHVGDRLLVLANKETNLPSCITTNTISSYEISVLNEGGGVVAVYHSEPLKTEKPEPEKPNPKATLRRYY